MTKEEKKTLMDRFGLMTDDEYRLAFVNYINLTRHEQIGVVRLVALNNQTYLAAREGLQDISDIHRFVKLLPIVQDRQAHLTALTKMLDLP